ncbi:hypothetical protein [Halorubrum saccharovorum]|nr:hypothetical protein [Halorubrum saccharovorum]
MQPSRRGLLGRGGVAAAVAGCTDALADGAIDGEWGDFGPVDSGSA